MPYIKQEDREYYKVEISQLVEKLVQTSNMNTTSAFPGHLNYIISTLLRKSYQGAGEAEGFSLTYNDYNDMIGILECAKLELYRKVITKYEDVKISQNGDID